MTEIQTVAVVVIAAIAITIAYYLGYAAGHERATAAYRDRLSAIVAGTTDPMRED